MGDEFKPRIIGALLECFIEFPLFGDDYSCLEKNGFVRQISPERCEWLKSKTSLAQYFKWVCPEKRRITGGFWSPISRAFGMNKTQLQKLAGGNGNESKKEKSRDFAALKTLVLSSRGETLRIRTEAEAYNAIMRLVSDSKCDTPEKIHVFIQKIKKILLKNEEKNEGK